MSASFSNVAWPGCLSALRLDRWMAGELGPAEAHEVRATADGAFEVSALPDLVASARAPDARGP